MVDGAKMKYNLNVKYFEHGTYVPASLVLFYDHVDLVRNYMRFQWNFKIDHEDTPVMRAGCADCPGASIPEELLSSSVLVDSAPRSFCHIDHRGQSS